MPTQRPSAPQKQNLNLIKSTNVRDVKSVRIPGIQKSFEEMTISELTQLRPGGNLQDTYEVNAVTDNVSVTTSALLHKLGDIRATEVMKQEQTKRMRSAK